VEPGQKIASADYERDSAIMTLLSDARAGSGVPPVTATGFVSVGGKVYLGAASLIVPNDERANGALERQNVEVYLTEFDSSKMSKVQTDFLLSGVSLTREVPEKDLAEIPLQDAAGRTVAYRKWKPSTPGIDLISAVAPYMGILIAAIGLVQLIGLTHWNSTVRQLKDTAAEAGRLRAESWSKTIFLANLNHELRTPLNAVIGFSEMMRMQRPEIIPDPWHSYAGDICASGKHLLQIGNDVLELTKLQNSDTGLDLSAIDLAAALEPVEAKLRASACDRAIAFEFDTAPADLIVKSNAEALRQIVLNLGHNV
jgi:signal transduction histidine kinase